MNYRTTLIVSMTEIPNLNSIAVGLGPYCVEFAIKRGLRTDGRFFISPRCYRAKDDVMVGSLYPTQVFEGEYRFDLPCGDTVTVTVKLID